MLIGGLDLLGNDMCCVTTLDILKKLLTQTEEVDQIIGLDSVGNKQLEFTR